MHAKTGRAEAHAFGRNQPSGFHSFLDELAHRGHLGGRRAPIAGFVRENADEAHGCPPGLCLATSLRRTTEPKIDTRGYGTRRLETRGKPGSRLVTPEPLPLRDSGRLATRIGHRDGPR